ncbi:MAG: hypothetical protein LBT46_08670 [Planctomycetaceae bacterium]|jgi:hypothetical protein|nr:hypothetical protein [Planctomycetaceae bacterium]
MCWGNVEIFLENKERLITLAEAARDFGGRFMVAILGDKTTSAGENSRGNCSDADAIEYVYFTERRDNFRRAAAIGKIRKRTTKRRDTRKSLMP